MEEKILLALIGGGSALLGAVVGSGGQLVLQWYKDYPNRELAKKRKALLNEMMKNKDFPWRKLETLSHVIGADEITTTALLIDLGARGDERGSGLWGLISRNPLPNTE